MLQSFADPVLPIFAILAVGYLAGARGWLDTGFARTLNGYVFFISQPALVFLIVAAARFDDVDWAAEAAYLASELVVYAMGTAVARFAFRRDWEEAILLGMTCAFVNHVFYVLPIAERIYGVEAAQPIAVVITVDIAVLFCGTILLLDLRRAGAAAPRQVARAMSRNPALIAIVLGGLANWAGGLVPPGVFTFGDFVGRSAPPVSLFALGIIMAAAPLRPVGGATWSIVGIKMLAHIPIAAGFLALSGTPAETRDILVLVAAGPCGAMPFVIALQYGVRTETIARAILISTAFSLITLSVLTS